MACEVMAVLTPLILTLVLYDALPMTAYIVLKAVPQDGHEISTVSKPATSPERL